jgi:hypothetical protein
METSQDNDGIPCIHRKNMAPGEDGYEVSSAGGQKLLVLQPPTALYVLHLDKPFLSQKLLRQILWGVRACAPLQNQPNACSFRWRLGGDRFRWKSKQGGTAYESKLG